MTFDSKTDLRSGFDRFSAENIKANVPIVDLLKNSQKRKKQHLHKLHLLGYWHKNHSLFQSREHEIWNACMRT